MTMGAIQPYKKWWREILLSLLLILNLLVWSILYGNESSNTLTVYFLDVGQGDAILIDTPNRKRVLIDGGKNRKVVSEIGRILPFSDKRIDVVLATHPDADHIGGLPEIISRYDVEIFIEPSVAAANDIDAELERRVEKEGVKKVLAQRGQVIDFGDGARLTILFPDRDVSSWETNDASIVARLDYGESSFLFTGDAGIKTENILIASAPTILNIDVFKAGHHGSRTSTSLTFAEVTSPEFAVISAGKDNTYGHPHEEVISILERVGSNVLNTADEGTIKFQTDGVTLRVN